MKRLILALVIGLFTASAAYAGGRGGISGDFRSAGTAGSSGGHQQSGGGGHHPSGQ
jgi:hypothetical protein